MENGRCIPKITEVYGKEVFDFKENSIVVTIPFNRINAIVGDNVVDKVGDKKLNATRQKILNEMRNNPNITHPQLMNILGLGKTAIQNNISYLRKKLAALNANIQIKATRNTGYTLEEIK